MLHHAALGLKNSINRAGQTIVEPFDKSKPTAMALNAGKFSLHHEFAVHRSAPDHTAHRRVGIGLNYLPPHVRVNSPVRLRAMLVRGKDRPRQLRPESTRQRPSATPRHSPSINRQRPLSRELPSAGELPRRALRRSRRTAGDDPARRAAGT